VAKRAPRTINTARLLAMLLAGRGDLNGLRARADGGDSYAREYLHLPCGPLSFGSDEDAIEQRVAKRMERQCVLYEPTRGSGGGTCRPHAPSLPTGVLANGRSLDADGGRTVAYKLD
jgi:hypothetical protein